MIGKGVRGVAPVCVNCIIITLPRKCLTGGGLLTFTTLNISEHLFNMLSIGVHRYPTMRDTLLPHCCHILDTIEPHLLRERASAPRCCDVLRGGKSVCDVTSLLRGAYAPHIQ